MLRPCGEHGEYEAEDEEDGHRDQAAPRAKHEAGEDECGVLQHDGHARGAHGDGHKGQHDDERGKDRGQREVGEGAKRRIHARELTLNTV